MTRSGDEPDGEPSTPTVRSAGAPTLVSVLLGDYWFAAEGFVPSAALAAVTADLGTRPEATRAALSRLTRRGYLEATRSGRHTAHRLAPPVREQALAMGRRLMTFGALPVTWDGSWLCLVLRTGATSGPVPPALTKDLTALGYAPLHERTWVRPGADDPRLAPLLARHEGVDPVLLTGRQVPVPGEAALADAWDLGPLRRRHEDLLALLEAVGPAVAAGELGAARALALRTEVILRWRALALADPRLPDELLPADWPLPRTRAAFVEVYDGLGPLAQARVEQLVAPLPACPAPSHHRVQDVAGR